MNNQAKAAAKFIGKNDKATFSANLEIAEAHF